MDGWQAFGVLAIPVLAGWSVLRVWLRSGGPRLTDRLAAGFWCSAGLAVGWSTGPGWLVPVSWVLIGLTLLTHLTGLVELFASRYVGPARGVDPEEFRLRLLAVCQEEATQGLVIGVGPDGGLVVWGLEAAGVGRDRNILTWGCPFCFLEDLVRELVPEADGPVQAYRALLARQANQLFVLRRGVIDLRWQAELRQVQGLKKPFANRCGTHRHGG
ncbi:hypothetical protein GCM10018781_04020 [Kitasatospora indigofera]|uniref:Uncharacterized protein n=1 Tax=Kitasatospora indigofera TaxID=67307 RepID=A0A919FBT3_9ACTN|nr:hypothetical protein [Kitasatospora indigofera]GHH59940.1 hypothetical protein GCM10018781_04020 [Kitasatospora indigofera]